MSFRDFRILFSILAEESEVLKQSSPIHYIKYYKLEAILVLFIKEKNMCQNDIKRTHSLEAGSVDKDISFFS